MGDVVSDIVDTVSNVVSDVTSSDLGKAAILAGTAYATGGASLAAEGGAGLFADMSMPTLAQAGSAMQIAGGINSLTGGGITNMLGGKGTVQQATSAVDPMAPYRQNMAAMYAGALQPGGTQDPTQMPGYSQFKSGVMDPALEASKRSSAASGMLRSGNEQIALQDVAQRGYSGFMADYMNRLATGAGVAQTPAAGAAAGTAAQGNIMQGVGAIGTGIAGIFGNKGGGGNTGALSPDNVSYYNTQASGFGNTGEMGLVY